MTKPGILRHLLDRFAAPLHNALTTLGTLSRPPELDDLNAYLRKLETDIEHELFHKTYIPVTGREVPPSSLPEEPIKGPSAKPVHQVIRQIAGISRGGDSATAQIAAANRKSRTVRHILAALKRADEPLILLGDPGTGKTMTLKQAAMELARREKRKVFPIVTVYVRLGEFRVAGEVGPAEVAEYVRRCAHEHEKIGPYLNALDRAGGRLVILFDGMDEMSRERYTEHTQALSRFAGERRGFTRTLFSCRITDFSPEFIHQQLVLLPFNRAQITEFLKRHIDAFPVTIDKEDWTLKRLAGRLAAGGLPMEANNPFVLWLLRTYLQEKKTWPSSRVALLEFFNRLNYERKAKEVRRGEPPFPAAEAAFAGWGRIAYNITALNRGAAVALGALRSGDPAWDGRVEELLRVGERCGVLVEASVNGEKLVRFEHHRFQEYFTALHIHDERPPMSWLDKLDAPRWQETMLNLILMGEANDAVRALANAIDEGVTRTRGADSEADDGAPEDDDAADEDDAEGAGEEGSEPAEQAAVGAGAARYSKEWETVTADRVDLASRILRQVGSGAPAARDALLSPFNKAVNFLSSKGNPITQVKMLQACNNVPDLDFVEVLGKSLKSPVNWVRNQALVVLASTDRSLRSVGSNFATEMAVDLANGQFPKRFPGYVKAALSSSSRRSWWCLASGTFCYLLNLLLLLGVAALIYFAAARVALPFGIGHWLDEPAFIAFYIAIILIASALTLKFAPHLLWAAVLASAAGSVLLFALMMVGWDVSLGGLLGAIFGIGIVGYLAAIPAGGLVGFSLHAATLILFLVLNPSVRVPGYSAGTFLSASWRGCGFRDAVLPLLEGLSEIAKSLLFVGGTLIVLLIAVPIFGGIYVYGLRPIGVWLNEVAGLPFHPLTTVSVAAVLCAAAVTVALSLATRKVAPYLRIWGLVIGTVVGGALGVPAVLALVGGVIWVLNYVQTMISGWFGPELGPAIVRLLLILILIAFVALAGWAVIVLAHEIVRLFRSGARPLRPGSVTPASWREQLARSKPELQRILLLRTNYQSLGMTPDEFLKFLEEAELLIKGEPALSTYWSQRAQLEQVLKQERVG